MYHVIEQTREEQRAMYIKLRKAEIVEMLLNNQEIVSRFFDKQNGPVSGESPGPSVASQHPGRS